jgi:hypothetical protein
MLLTQERGDTVEEMIQEAHCLMWLTDVWKEASSFNQLPRKSTFASVDNNQFEGVA